MLKYVLQNYSLFFVIAPQGQRYCPFYAFFYCGVERAWGFSFRYWVLIHPLLLHKLFDKFCCNASVR